MITAVRYHDFSCGHRVHGHENKCAHLHGHNYRVTFHCSAASLDNVGRVLDFGVMKDRLCSWLERAWDHKMLLWKDDPLAPALLALVPADIVLVPFNPTAENMADFILREAAPALLAGTGVKCVRVDVEETRKCSATSSL